MKSIIYRSVLRESVVAPGAISGDLNVAGKSMKQLPPPKPQMQRPMAGKPGNVMASANTQAVENTQSKLARQFKPGKARGKVKPSAAPAPAPAQPGQSMMQRQSMVLRGILRESNAVNRIMRQVARGSRLGVKRAADMHNFRVNGGKVNKAQSLVRDYMNLNGKHLVRHLPDTAPIHQLKSGRGVNALVASAQSTLLHSMVTRGMLREAYSKAGKDIISTGKGAYSPMKGNLMTSKRGDDIAAQAAAQRKTVRPVGGVALSGAQKPIQRAVAQTGAQAMSSSLLSPARAALKRATGM